MLLRAITLAGGLTGAMAVSQFPEFSQQYVQRLGGAVDEISRVVAAFDKDAATLDLSRAQALTQLAGGGDLGAARAASMEATIARADRLTADLAALASADLFQRSLRIYRFSDREIAASTYAVFRPALPLTVSGLLFAATGFVLGALGLGGLLALIRLPFR